jgi:hypothetical protein
VESWETLSRRGRREEKVGLNHDALLCDLRGSAFWLLHVRFPLVPSLSDPRRLKAKPQRHCDPRLEPINESVRGVVERGVSKLVEIMSSILGFLDGVELRRKLRSRL